MTVDLSVVVVNYNSAALIESLLESLLEDPFQVAGRPGTLEVVVVDNASRLEDHGRFEALKSDRVSLIRNTENVGYGLANNQGFEVTRGRWHLVSNPDVRVVPGCLQTLVDAVETLPDAAIVGPLATMDPEGQVLMPPNELPDPYLETLTAVARHDDRIARYNARRRTRFAHDYWTATEPLRLPMLSGGFFLGRRRTFEEHGLFDPAYPLYYEDTDLFRRYHLAGLGLWHVPDARIVHHFSKSAIPVMKAAMYRHSVGARRYYHKFFGAAGARTWRSITSRAESRGQDDTCPFPLEDLPASPHAPTLEIPPEDGLYLEVAGNPKFSLTVGIFPDQGGPYVFPDGFWGPLPPTRYWSRVVRASTGETLKAWRITKCPPS